MLISILINHIYLSDDLMTPLFVFCLTHKMTADEITQLKIKTIMKKLRTKKMSSYDR